MHIRIIFLLSCLAILSCSNNRERDFSLPCMEPTETSVGAMELAGLIYPSSATRIARDLWDPEANTDHYGIKVRSSIKVKNVSGGTLYLDSLQVEFARENGKNAVPMMMVFDSSLVLKDSATETVSWVSEVRLDKMDAKFMEDLLMNQGVALVQAAPSLFIRFDDSHACRELEGFEEDMLGTAAEMTFNATIVTVKWIYNNPGESLDILFAFISVLLKIA